MNKIDKFLKLLSPKEREQIKRMLNQLIVQELSGLDIKKLKESEDIFRVRKGDIRIMYRVVDNEVFILAIERQSEKTYRKY